MAEAKISGLPAVTVPTTAMTFETVQSGTSKQVTLAQMLSLAGDVVGPGASTDNAFVRMDGVTGKLIQNSTALLTDTGRGQFGDGVVGGPALSFLSEPTSGLYRAGAGNIAMSILGVAVAAFQASTLSFVSGYKLDVASTNGVLIIAGEQTTSANGPVAFQNQQVFSGAAGIAQTGVRIIAGVNQTSTASFAALKIELGTVIAGTGAPVFGSGGGFFIDAQANSTSVFKVTSAGAVQVGDGTTSIVGLGYVSEVNTGWNRTGAGTITYVSAGTQYWSFSSAIVASVNGQQIRSAVANGSLIASGNATTGNVANWIFANANNYTGAAAATQIGVQLTHTINQTSTAAFTSLDIVRTETAVGSGAQYFINAKAGAAGTTQIYAVDNAGRAYHGSGAAALPSISFVSFPTVGLFTTAATQLAFSLNGSQYLSISTSGTTLSMGAATATTDFYLFHGASTTTARMVLLSASGSNNSYTASQICATNNTAWTGSSVEQRQFGIYPGVNQTSTATFTALDINATVAALGAGSSAPVFGSGGGFAIKVSTGGSSPTLFAALTFAGQMQVAAGSGTVPGLTFIGATTTGLYTSGGYTGFVSAGADAALVGITSGNATFQGRVGDAWFTTAVNNAAVSLRASSGTGTGAAVKIINASTWTHAGTAAIMMQIAQTVNQTGAATSTYLDFAITETAVGTGAQLFINAKAGAAGTTAMFQVTNQGGFQIAVVSPSALASGNTDDYAGTAGYSFARIATNAAGSTLRGILAPVPVLGRRLTLINIGGVGTLTINNQDAGSAAANRIQTTTGAATILAVNGTMELIYDVTSAFWRQI